MTYEPTLFDVAEARPLVHVDPSRPRRDLAAHHVRIEPTRGTMSVAFLVDEPRVRDTGATPHVALCRLMGDPAIDPRVIPVGGSPCAACKAPNACVADSPTGSSTFAVYCDHPLVGTDTPACTPKATPR